MTAQECGGCERPGVPIEIASTCGVSGIHSPGLARVIGFAPSHPFASSSVSDPVNATNPPSCIRASMMPISAASFPSEYCW